MATLDEVRASLRRARDLTLQIAALEADLKHMAAELQHITSEQLPNLFQSANIDQLGLPAEGNMPAYDAELQPYYRANIAANWPRERRDAAFDYLAAQNAKDLIKSVITVKLGLDSAKEQEKVVKALRKTGVDFDVKKDVPWSTLTSWVKEMVERGRMPDLDKIGGTVGQVVKLTEREP